MIYRDFIPTFTYIPNNIVNFSSVLGNSES